VAEHVHRDEAQVVLRPRRQHPQVRADRERDRLAEQAVGREAVGGRQAAVQVDGRAGHSGREAGVPELALVRHGLLRRPARQDVDGAGVIGGADDEIEVAERPEIGSGIGAGQREPLEEHRHDTGRLELPDEGPETVESRRVGEGPRHRGRPQRDEARVGDEGTRGDPAPHQSGCAGRDDPRYRLGQSLRVDLQRRRGGAPGAGEQTRHHGTGHDLGHAPP